jgi:predicted Zn-dependent peptidase
VTKADVMRVASKYLGTNRVVIYRRYGKPNAPQIQKPNFTPIKIDSSRESSFAKRVLALPVKPISPRWLEAGKDYEIRDTSFGSLYTVANPFDDVFSLDFKFKRGSHDQKDLCAALSVLDLSGAGNMPASEFKKKLFSMGTKLYSSCGEREMGVSLQGLEKNLWPSLKLLNEHFENPNISSSTLQKFVQVSIGAHQDAKKDPQAVFYALSQWAKRGKNSSVLHELSDQELQSLKLKNLRKIIRHVFDYRRRVGYVGNRASGEVAKLLETSANLKKTPKQEPLVYLEIKKPIVYFTNRDMVQAKVGIFAPDETLNPAHAVDYQFFGSYMGGGMSSVIFQEVRESHSYAYSAGGGYFPGNLKGDQNQLYGGLGCQADKTADAAVLLQNLLHSPPISQPRFDETLKALEESYRANPVFFRSIPDVLMSWRDEGLPPGDPRPERFKILSSYQLKNLSDFAARFKDKPMAVYILGYGKRVGLDYLKTLGPLKEKKLGDIFPY